MKQILIIAAVLIAHNGFSQLDWSHTFGSTGIDRAGNIHTVNNDSYVFTSIENYSGSSGNTVVKKLDLTGSELWTQSYGNNFDDECTIMKPTSNGEFVLSGFTRSFASVGYTGTVDLYSASWIFKIDANGNQIWTRSIGGESYGDNYVGHITLSLLDEPIRWGQVQYHSGCNNYSTSLTKLNTNGSNVWSYCEAFDGGGRAISRLSSVNEYIAGGRVATGDPSSLTFRKYNDSGDEIWNVNYNPGDGNEALQSISNSIDGGYYAIGNITGSSFEQNDIFISKFTTDGILEWERFYGFSENDFSGELIETSGGYLGFTGQTRSNNNTTSRVWVMKLDLSGNLISEYFFGNGEDLRVGSFICEAPDGDFVISGHSNESGNQESLVFKVGLCEPSGLTQTISTCETFTWIDGNTYTESNNTATFVIPNAAGCDSTITLDLTILNPSSSIDEHEACESFTWIDGNTYTENNSSATFVTTNAAGCDSSITLNLTILESSNSTDIHEVCDEFTWIDGNTYTESNNTATFLTTNTAGCDSIITLNLTINNLTTLDAGIDQTVCEGTDVTLTATGAAFYEWDNGIQNGVPFPALLGSNIYSVEGTDANGCEDEQSVTITGTPYPELIFEVTDPACQGEASGNVVVVASNGTSPYTFVWNNGALQAENNGIAAGTYEVIVTDNVGCETQGTVLVIDPSEPCFNIPGGISPNGDGINDTWTIGGLSQFSDAKVNVFDRWGQTVYSGNATSDAWDGKINGKECPTADYYYILELGDGQKFNGVVTLKR